MLFLSSDHMTKMPFIYNWLRINQINCNIGMHQTAVGHIGGTCDPCFLTL